LIEVLRVAGVTQRQLTQGLARPFISQAGATKPCSGQR
jgi:hypothetical protein